MNKDKKENQKFKFNEKEYILVEPSTKAVRNAKLKYSIRFTECINEGLYTKANLQKELEKRDSEFYNEYVKQKMEIQERISETEEKIKTEESSEQLSMLANLLSIYRAQGMERDQLMNELFDNTAESFAEEERLSYLAFEMIRDLEGNKIFETYEEMMEEISTELLDQFQYRVSCWNYKLDPEWHEKLPEVKAMKRAEKLFEEEEKKKEKEKVDKKKAKEKKEVKKIKTKSSSKKKPGRKKKKVKKEE